MENPETLEDLVDHFLEEAINEANVAYKSGEVPVGCVIVYKNEIIGRGHNQTNATRNPTRHAEFVAIDQVLTKYKSDIFQHCTLYVTIEPCIMCASCLILTKFKCVYTCAGNDKFGGCGSVLTLNQGNPIHNYKCIYRYKTKAIQVLQDFYNQTNPLATNPIKKKKIMEWTVKDK